MRREGGALRASVPLALASRLLTDGGPEDDGGPLGGPPRVGDVGEVGVSGDDSPGGEWHGIAASYGVERGPLLKMELDDALTLSARASGMEARSPAPSLRVSVSPHDRSPAREISPPRESRSSRGPEPEPASRAPAGETTASASSSRGRSGRNALPGSNSRPPESVGVPGALVREGDEGDDRASSEARAGAAPAFDRARCDDGGGILTPRALARENARTTTGRAKVLRAKRDTRTRHARHGGWIDSPRESSGTPHDATECLPPVRTARARARDCDAASRIQ